MASLGRTAALAGGFGVLPLFCVLILTNGASATPPQAAPSWVEAEVLRVITTKEQQSVVVLRAPTEKKLVPIWIGEAEANAIRLRLAGQRTPRPLTHDLLDRVIIQLGGKLVKVHIEDLRDNVFYGRIFIKQGSKTVDMDARPSDSIALAVGSRVPVLLARRVLDVAGISEESLPAPRGGRDTL